MAPNRPLHPAAFGVALAAAPGLQRSNEFINWNPPASRIVKPAKTGQSVLIGRCERAMGWDARGAIFVRLKKLRDESRTNFSIPRVLSPQNRSTLHSRRAEVKNAG